ncbi:hypothetical protein [Demequina soli]|uniref:hypothetical protein n=1 Tax=Demequina soli TaxID=1638987 RepID=UPI000783898B|nr:hypothetical protein [Demequina soli]
MTATAYRPFPLGANQVPHRHLMERFHRHRSQVKEARHQERVEHHREMQDLHELELLHDPRDWRARHTLDTGGIRPFIIA